MQGNLKAGLDYQSAAFEVSRLFTIKSDAEINLRLLVLAAPIHMGGNTPVEFLLENSSISITTLYVLPNLTLERPLPDHDLIFVAAPGDSDHTRQFIMEIERLVENRTCSILNHPKSIIGLERDQLCNTLADIPNLIAPLSVRCERSTLVAVGQGGICIDDALPVVVRPVGSHAGHNLEKLTHSDEIDAYLDSCPDQEFFIAQYIDYRSDDGLFRKYRIVFVDGHPFACHMAIADQWKIWYLNAEMEKSSSKLYEEERFMTFFDTEFGARQKQVLASIAQRVDLDYFGIDCAETRDGKLVLFEADNALIVHDMDPKDTYPYKSPQMNKVFKAFEEMLRAKALLNDHRSVEVNQML